MRVKVKPIYLTKYNTMKKYRAVAGYILDGGQSVSFTPEEGASSTHFIGG
jgi:hypothetical protein